MNSIHTVYTVHNQHVNANVADKKYNFRIMCASKPKKYSLGVPSKVLYHTKHKRTMARPCPKDGGGPIRVRTPPQLGHGHQPCPWPMSMNHDPRTKGQESVINNKFRCCSIFFKNHICFVTNYFTTEVEALLSRQIFIISRRASFNISRILEGRCPSF